MDHRLFLTLQYPRWFNHCRETVRSPGLGLNRILTATALALWAASAASAASAPVATAAPKPLDAMLRLVGLHVRQFEASFASVIGDEDYVQVDDLPQSSEQRLIHSEVLSVWIPDARRWMWARNVLIVDGAAVDGSSRLDEVATSAGPNLLRRLQGIRNAGARFNIGAIDRNLNDPTFALLFLDPGMQPRFKFHLDGKEKIGDTDAVKISFSEHMRPTLVRDGSKDAPANGAVWVSPSDGGVLRTQLTFVLKDAAPGHGPMIFNGPGGLVEAAIDMNAEIEVDYQHDAGMESWVPAQMRERYRQTARLSTIETVRCTATYSNFRKFQTAARLVPGP
jgi:hypothetical protein